MEDHAEHSRAWQRTGRLSEADPSMTTPAKNPFLILDGAAPQWSSAPKIESLLIKPASALCNLDCEYCFYLDREADPYEASRTRIMTRETLQRMVEGYLSYSYPHSAFAFQGG